MLKNNQSKNISSETKNYKLQTSKKGNNIISVLEHIDENKYKIAWNIEVKDSKPICFLKFFSETKFIYMNWSGAVRVYDLETKKELFYKENESESSNSRAILSDEKTKIYLQTKIENNDFFLEICLLTFKENKRILLPYDVVGYIESFDKVGDKFYFYQSTDNKPAHHFSILDIEKLEIIKKELPYPHKKETLSPLFRRVIDSNNRKIIMPLWDKIELLKNEKGTTEFVYKIIVINIDTFEVDKIIPVLHFNTRMLSYYESEGEEMHSIFTSKQFGTEEYDDFIVEFIENLNTIQLAEDSKSFWACFRGGLVRKINYNGNLSPLYVTASLPESERNDEFGIYHFDSHISELKDDGVILKEDDELSWMPINDYDKFDEKIENYVSIELEVVPEKYTTKILKTNKDITTQKESKYNIVEITDFNDEKSVIEALNKMLKMEFERKGHYVAFLYKDKNGEYLEEKAFFQKAVKIEDAIAIMETIAYKTLKFGIKRFYGGNNEDHSLFNLFYQLVESNKIYAQLGIDYLNAVDLDHDTGNLEAIIEVIKKQIGEKSLQEMLSLQQNKSVKEYYND